MAEVTGLRNSVLPYAVYGVPYGVTFPILDADGDLTTGASSLDSEVSLNGDTFADCTNEATEIAASSGMYYLLLTAAEMTADVVTVIVKTGTAGAKTTPIVLYPRKLVTLRSGTSAGGASGSITLDSGASAVDDYYNGCLIIATLDSAVEARIISDYVGSTKVASVVPDWVTTPDSDDTFIIKIPEGVQVQQADVSAFGGAAGTFSSGRPEVNTSHIAGNSAAASALDRSARTIVRFTVGSGSTTTNIVTSSMDPAAAVADQFVGRVVVFDRDTTSANLRGQGTDIAASTDDGELTVTALTNAPVSGDTGVIL